MYVCKIQLISRKFYLIRKRIFFIQILKTVLLKIINIELGTEKMKIILSPEWPPPLGILVSACQIAK